MKWSKFVSPCGPWRACCTYLRVRVHTAVRAGGGGDIRQCAEALLSQYTTDRPCCISLLTSPAPLQTVRHLVQDEDSDPVRRDIRAAIPSRTAPPRDECKSRDKSMGGMRLTDRTSPSRSFQIWIQHLEGDYSIARRGCGIKAFPSSPLPRVTSVCWRLDTPGSVLHMLIYSAALVTLKKRKKRESSVVKLARNLEKSSCS